MASLQRLLATTGNESLTASGAGSVTGSTTVSVQAAILSLVISDPGQVTAGASFSFSVTAFDQFGQVASAYTGTVGITSSDSAASLPSAATLTAGVGTFTVTLNTVGESSITATDSANTAIVGTLNIAVSAVNQLGVAVTDENGNNVSSVDTDTKIQIWVTVLDVNGNVISGYSGDAVIFVSDGIGTPSTIACTITNGTGLVDQVSLGLCPLWTLTVYLGTADDYNASGETGSTTITVTAPNE